MNKLSLFGLSMATGLTWLIAIISIGLFAMYILKDGYSSGFHENVINSVVIFRGIFGLAYPGWAMDLVGTILSGLWGFVHGFITGFLIAFFYNIFSKLINEQRKSKNS
tara:strand:+ start:45 stop:368 length:324 start_codon:yes stop_codon:yes gene_type:complete